MKFKVRFRVSGFTNGENSRKFMINLEADKPFTLGNAIPEQKRSIAQLVVRGGNLYVNDRKDRDLDVNGSLGKEFRLKPGDLLKSGSVTVEFLEVPVAPEEAPAQTQFLDISEITSADEGTRVEAFTQVALEKAPEQTAPIAEKPHQVARPFDAPTVEADPVEFMIGEGSPSPYEPTRAIERTQVESAPLQREVVSELVKRHQQQPQKKLPEREREKTREHTRERFQSPDSEPTRMNNFVKEGTAFLERLNPSEITSMLARKPSDAPLQRHELFTTLGLLFLASALTAGASKLGFPLTWGFVGVGVAAAIAAGLHAANPFTGAKGSFGDYLRFLSVFSFGLVFWGYSFRLSWIAAVVLAIALGGAFFVNFVRRFQPQLARFAPVGGLVAVLPAIASFALQWSAISPDIDSSKFAASTARNSTEEQTSPPVETAPVHADRKIASEPVVAQNSATQAPQAQVPSPVQSAPSVHQAQPVQPVAQVAPSVASVPHQDSATQALNPVGSERASLRESVPDPLASEQFFSAVKSGNLGVVRSMIQKKAVDPNFTLDRGNTALMYASANGHLNIVKYLVSLRVAINARDPNGTTALMWAVYKGRTDVARFLVSKGADVRLHRDDGDTALDIAKRWKRWDIAEILQAAKETERMPASDRRHGSGKRGRR